jgi:uncharacterized OsmC-like protein
VSKNIKKLYRDAGLKPPDGKGIHTAAFHRCVVQLKKKMRAGKSKKVNPYAVCMASLGAAKAVKKGHRGRS